MKTYNNLYDEIISLENLFLAWRGARKGKTKRNYVIEFEKDLPKNLEELHYELKDMTYKPKLLVSFILRDPKTRKISKSAFRDRIVHHALVRIIEPIFNKIFIYDSCANRIGKGTLFALKRFDFFKRKVTNNLKSEAFCLKADVKHYFNEVDHDVLAGIIKRKIKDEKAMWLIKQILNNTAFNSRKSELGKSMPLGNLTSQFFANVYLNELDYFAKHKLKAKYYIRYVDDFIILHRSKIQLESWKDEIDNFLKENLKIELHSQKSRVISLSKGIDFVGFRNFWHYKLLRKRNIRTMNFKVDEFKQCKISEEKLFESFQGWNAYAKWADTFKLRSKIENKIYALTNILLLK